MTIIHQSKFDFVDEVGNEIPAHRHVNPDGKVGGWVANNAEIGAGAIIEPGAIVPPHAKVPAGRRVRGDEVFKPHP